jgi:four helix bundle protein
MTNVYTSFEEMPVWQAAQDLAVRVYQDMAKVRDYSFADQIKRAAVSVSNNVAEGAERGTPTDFARFLDIAKGSAGEVRSMYYLALRLAFIQENDLENRIELCKSISRQLSSFARHLRSK